MSYLQEGGTILHSAAYSSQRGGSGCWLLFEILSQPNVKLDIRNSDDKTWSDYLDEEDLERLVLTAEQKPIAWKILEETIQNKQKAT